MSEFDEMNARVIAEFRANEGTVGGGLDGYEVILVHHVGARSGTTRVLPVVLFRDGDQMVIVASGKAGADRAPQWYLNLKATPRVTVEVGAETFTVDVTEITEPDRTAIWGRIKADAPLYAEYDRKAPEGRTIPLLLLTRVGEADDED